MSRHNLLDDRKAQAVPLLCGGARLERLNEPELGGWGNTGQSSLIDTLPRPSLATTLAAPRAWINALPTKFAKALRTAASTPSIQPGHAFDVIVDTHPNSDVPSIAPQSIYDQRTETISLSEQLLHEWNHRLKNNLQILVGLLESGYRKARNSEAREVLSDAIRRIGAIAAAQGAYCCARGSSDVNGQDLVNAVCDNARILFGSGSPRWTNRKAFAHFETCPLWSQPDGRLVRPSR